MAKTSAAPAESKVSTAAILRSLKTKEAAAKTAAKQERPKSTRMDDSELIERLGLEMDQTASFSANVNSIKLTCAKGDKDRVMFIFNYTLSSDDKNVNGVPISNSFIIEDKVYTSGKKKGEVWESVEEVIKKLMFEFQALGFDTAAWAKDKTLGVWGNAEKACKEATAEKVGVRITLKPWESDNSSGINVWVNPGMSNDDLEEDEEEEAEDEEEVEEEESEEAEDESSEEESEEEEEESEEEEEESDEEEEAEFDPNDYLDRWFDFDSGDEYGVVLIKPTKYYEKKNLFDSVDRDGNKWLVADGFGAAPDKLDYNESENDE